MDHYKKNNEREPVVQSPINANPKLRFTVSRKICANAQGNVQQTYVAN